MKALLGAFASLGVIAGLTPRHSAPQWILIAGDAQGYLSPCGCSDPMSGGIRRLGTIVRASGKDAVLLYNGALVKVPGKQSEMKAETLAQTLATLRLTALNLVAEDSQLGKGPLLSVLQLSKGRVVNAQGEWQDAVNQGDLRISGASMKPQALRKNLGIDLEDTAESVSRFATNAFGDQKAAILLLDGGLEDARKLATENPTLGAIVYRSIGDPPAQPEREGGTLLLTPGDKGRNVVRVSSDFQRYEVIRLGPSIKDDPEVARIYANYLRRVNSSDLLERYPRVKGAAFAGTAACVSCHPAAAKVWKGSSHAHALTTLEKEGHPRDPDCVKCHVVGLGFTTGFKSRAKTAQLADVGCESCHGAAAAHAKKPSLKLPRVSETTCRSCHTSENSPNFDFKTYWQRIKH